MRQFQKPLVHTGPRKPIRASDKLTRRPPDHLEWWNYSRANELDLPESINRYGSKWHLFEKTEDKKRVLVAWHEEKPEIYIRLDSDYGPVGPEALNQLHNDYREAKNKLLPLRSSIAKLPLIKFASTYKINTKLNRIDYLLNEHFRLMTTNTNDSLVSNLEGLHEAIENLPIKLRQIGIELDEHGFLNKTKVSQIYQSNPPPSAPVQFTTSEQLIWSNRIKNLTKPYLDENNAISEALENLPRQARELAVYLNAGIEILKSLNRSIDHVKQMPEITFSLPKTISLEAPNGDRIQQNLVFELIIKE